MLCSCGKFSCRCGELEINLSLEVLFAIISGRKRRSVRSTLVICNVIAVSACDDGKIISENHELVERVES